MAGEVTGVIGGQDVVLENAATEATLEALLKATLANVKDKSAADKIQKAYEDAVKKTTVGTMAQLKAAKEEERQRNVIVDQLEKEKKFRANMLELLEGLGNTIGRGVNVAFATSVPKINDFTNALSGIPIIGPIIGAFGNALQTSIDSFRDLTNVGANFGAGINDVRQAAAAAGLSLDGFRKIITANSADLALFGGSTNAGAQTFSRLSKQLQDNVQPRLARLGIGFEETSEYLAGYLSIQTRLGRAQTMTDAQLLAGTEEYILQLDRLARITGLNRREAEEAMKRQTLDKQFRAILQSMPEQQRQQFMVLNAALERQAPDLAATMREYVVTGGTPITELGNSISLFNQDFARSVAAMGRGQASQEDVIRAIQNGAVQARNVNQEYARIASIASLTGRDIAMGFTAFQGLENLGQQFTQASLEQQRDMENMAKSVADVERRFLNIRNAIMLAIEPALMIFSDGITGASDILDPNGRFIEGLRNFFVTIATGIHKFMEVMGADGLGEALRQTLTGMGNFLGPILSDMFKTLFKDLFTSPIVIGGLVAAITALIAGRAAINALTTAMTKPQLMGPPRPSAGFSPAVKGGIAGLAIGGAASVGADILGRDTRAGASVDVLGNAATYAGTGAMLGMMLGPKGAAVGALLGGAYGLGSGLWSNRGTLFGGKREDHEKAVDPALETAAAVASVTTEAEVRQLANALKELDYNRLTVPDAAINSIELGTNKVKALRGEVDAVSKSFRTLNDTGLDKITRGLERLSKEFKEFNRSFLEDFMSKFTELDKTTQEQLLTELNSKTDMLNINMQRLVTIQEELVPYARHTSRNTRNATGNLMP